MRLIGALLVIVSLPILGLMAVEIVVGWHAYNKYEVERLGDRVSFGNHVIEVDRPTDLDPHNKGGLIRVRVDGETRIEVPIAASGAAVNVGEVELVKLREQRTGIETVNIVEYQPGDAYPRASRYRILVVESAGAIRADEFAYSDRTKPVYRGMLAKFVHPEPLGLYSQVLSVWPTVLYPVVYPWISAAAGGLLLAFALVRRRQRGAA